TAAAGAARSAPAATGPCARRIRGAAPTPPASAARLRLPLHRWPPGAATPPRPFPGARSRAGGQSCLRPSSLYVLRTLSHHLDRLLAANLPHGVNEFLLDANPLLRLQKRHLSVGRAQLKHYRTWPRRACK